MTVFAFPIFDLVLSFVIIQSRPLLIRELFYTYFDRFGPKTKQRTFVLVDKSALQHGGEWRTRTVDLPRVRRTL